MYSELVEAKGQVDLAQSRSRAAPRESIDAAEHDQRLRARVRELEGALAASQAAYATQPTLR